MEIRQMIYFKELAACLSLPAAARALYITPQALSKSMRNLAQEFNTEIFYREHGKLCLTTFGQALLKEITVLLDQVSATEERLKNMASQENSHLRVACSHGILQGSFYAVFDDFKHQHPEIEIEFLELPDIFAEQMVEQEDCDLGLSINLPNKPEFFETTRLQHYQLCAVVHPQHPLAKQKITTLKDCAQYPLITKNRIFKIWQTVEQCAMKQHLRLSYALTSPNEIAWKQLVQDNQGVGIGTTYYLKPNQPEELPAIPFIEPELTWDICLIRRKDHYCSRSCDLLIQALKEAQDPDIQ